VHCRDSVTVVTNGLVSLQTSKNPKHMHGTLKYLAAGHAVISEAINPSVTHQWTVRSRN